MNADTGIRLPAAGPMGFYPMDPAALTGLLAGLLADTEGDVTALPAARRVIAPHAGYRFSGYTAAMALGRLDLARLRRVLLIGPTHTLGDLRGIAVSPSRAYRTPLGDLPVDRAACAALLAADGVFVSRPEAHSREHGLEVELPFLQHRLASLAGAAGAGEAKGAAGGAASGQPALQIVPLVCGRVSPAEVLRAATALNTLMDATTGLIVSSDFTHYGPRFGYLPFPETAAAARLPALDAGALARITAGDATGFAAYVAETGATICGVLPIRVQLTMDALAGRPPLDLLHATNSGTMTGDFVHSVGYAALADG